MKLVDLIPDPDALLVLEPDERELRMLPVLVPRPTQELIDELNDL